LALSSLYNFVWTTDQRTNNNTSFAATTIDVKRQSHPLFRGRLNKLATIKSNHAKEQACTSRPRRIGIVVVVVVVGSLLHGLAESQLLLVVVVVQQQQQLVVVVVVIEPRRSQHVPRSALPEESCGGHSHRREGIDKANRYGTRDRSGHGEHDRAVAKAVQERDRDRIRQSDDTRGAEACRGHRRRAQIEGRAGRCDQDSLPVLRRVRCERAISDLVGVGIQVTRPSSDVSLRGDDVSGGIRVAIDGAAGGGVVLSVEREHAIIGEGRSIDEGGEE
jgi:hypothetical protein